MLILTYIIPHFYQQAFLPLHECLDTDEHRQNYQSNVWHAENIDKAKMEKISTHGALAYLIMTNYSLIIFKRINLFVSVKTQLIMVGVIGSDRLLSDSNKKRFDDL